VQGIPLQTDYWDRVAPEKRFSHPLRLDWLLHLRSQARILDHGCGYGRLLNQLSGAGGHRWAGS
jgi:2-polyprenyl-3-methyl-5-hydroxy-6-metoxy-1,4-benzoquinol methylase